MMRRLITNISIIVFVLAAGLAVVPSSTVSADPCPNQNPLFPQWFDGMCKPSTNGQIRVMGPNEMGSGGQGGAGNAQSTGQGIGRWLASIALNVVKTLLTVVGYISLGFIIWGGFKYMTQGDNAGGTAGARKTIQNAVIGLVISIMSVAIINFIVGSIAG